MLRNILEVPAHMILEAAFVQLKEPDLLRREIALAVGTAVWDL